MCEVIDIPEGSLDESPSKKQRSSKKDIMTTPDFFLTKAEREEKKRRLEKRPEPVIDIIRQHHGDCPVMFFYDKALKVKFTRDEDSAEMLDIIRDGICFQFGYYYTVTLNEGATDWRIRDVLALKKNVASTFAACEGRLESNLEKILAFYRE